MDRSSFVFGLGFIHWLILFVYCFPNQSREVFRELQDRPPCMSMLRLIYSETSINRTPSIKRTLSLVPKRRSDIFLYNEPLFHGHLC